MKVLFYFIITVFFTGCAIKSEVDNYNVISEFKDENLTYNVNSNWYKDYNQPYLDFLIGKALKNNYDLRISALNVMEALAGAGIVSADMLPTFLANYNVNTKRDITKNDSNWNRGYQGSVLATYEIDLFGKIKNSVDAQEWLVKAGEFDLENIKLLIVNSIVDAYFKQLYLQDSIELIDKNLANYTKLRKITSAKYSFGKSEIVALKEVEQSIYNLENSKLSYQNQILQNERLIRELLGEKPEFDLNFKNLNLKSIYFQNIDLNVPYYSLSNRPDLKAAISKINSSFYGYKVSQKNFYPSITIGASLDSNARHFDDSFEFDILGGNISIKLPFLDYVRLKQKLKIAEIDFEKNKLGYEKSLSNALNEVNFYYKNYQLDLTNLNNLRNTLKNDNEISKIYAAKYEYGKSEMKDYLNAKNKEINTEISIINQTYKVFLSEINTYKAMAGKFKSI